MSRNYPSGAKKRAFSLKRKKIDAELAEKTPKLHSFFKPTSSTKEDGNVETAPAIESDTAGVKDVEQAPTFKKVDVKDDTAKKPLEDSDSHAIYDLYFWPEREKMSEAFRNYWIQRGATPCQNKNGDFKESVIQLEKESQRRFCAISLFTRVHARTGEQFERNWLCYSKTSGCVYCFVCKLMSSIFYN